MKKISEEELLEKLDEGREIWTKWRQSTNNEKLYCTDANILGKDLGGFSINNVSFKDCAFVECNLKATSFSHSNYENVTFKGCEFGNSRFLFIIGKNISLDSAKGAKVEFIKSTIQESSLFDNDISNKMFSDVDFVNMDMSSEKSLNVSFSGIKVDDNTRNSAKKNSKITIGLNGIYNQKNNSASLVLETPAGDRMTGGDEDIILNSLTKSKKAFVTSVSATLITFTINFVGINSFAFLGIKINPKAFCLLAIPIIIFSLYKSNVLLRDVTNNIKYISSQTGAMKIGKFPWLLSRYGGSNFWNKLESFLFRLVYCFHPLFILPVLISFLFKSTFENSIPYLNISERLCDIYTANSNIIIALIWILYGWTLYFCLMIMIKSQKLQKPLLFDIANPTERSSPESEVAESLQKIEKLLSDFIGPMSFSGLDWRELQLYIKTKLELAKKELEEKNK